MNKHMEENEDIIDVIYEKKSEDAMLSLDDSILSELDNKIEKYTNDITKFINKRVHPKTRFHLKKILDRKENTLYDYSIREKKLLYKDGFRDGMQVMLYALLDK